MLLASPLAIAHAYKMAVAAASTQALRSTEVTHRLAIESVSHIVQYAYSPEYALPVSRADFVRCVGHAISAGDRLGGLFLDWYSDLIEWCLR